MQLRVATVLCGIVIVASACASARPAVESPLVSSPSSVDPPATSIPAAPRTSIDSAITEATATSITASSVVTPVQIEVALSGPEASCAESVPLRTEWDQDTILATVAGERIVQVTGGLSRGIAILSMCGDDLLVTTGTWSFDAIDLNDPFHAPAGATDQMRFRWLEDPLVLEQAPSVADADEYFTEAPMSLPTELEATVAWKVADGIVGGVCGELSISVAAYLEIDGIRVPWEFDGTQLAMQTLPRDFVASPSGDFAIEEWICTDDGSWSRLILGSFDPRTGELLEFRRLNGFQSWGLSHRGPAGVSVDGNGGLQIEIGDDPDTLLTLPVDGFCNDASPLRDGGADFALYQGRGGLQTQLHHCVNGVLMASHATQTEGTVFWSSDVNSDNVDEVFVGGTSVSAGGADAWTLVDGRLLPIIVDGEKQLHLWDGDLGNIQGLFGCTGEAFAQLEVDRKNSRATVTLTVYRFDGQEATVVRNDSVELPAHEVLDETGLVRPDVDSAFAIEIGPCN